MKRVRYPFIVRYSPLKEGNFVTFAHEHPERGYERTQDELEATVYTDLKMFKKFYNKSPTAYVADFHGNPWVENTMDYVYVGE